VDTAALERAYAREQQSWLHDLGWDTAWTWATVEGARRSRSLPGFVACDADGALCGWGFAMVDAGALHIGGLVADAAPVTGALLDALLAESPGPAACFVRDSAPGLTALLAGRGWSVERFLYLTRPVAAGDVRFAATA